MSPASGEGERTDPLDVEELMRDLRRRVAEKKARGLYGVDALLSASVEDDGEPFGLDELERLRELAVQRVDIEVAASTKPLVGGILSRLKRLLVRGTSQPMYGLSARATAFNGALLAYLSALAREVAALERQVRAGHEETARATAEAQRLGGELAAALARLASVEADVGRLADAALPERVARLERPASGGAAAPPPEAPPPDLGGDSVRLRLEAVEAAADVGAPSRRAGYVDGLRPDARVLLLGAGSGRALEHLGARAEGVEADGELAAAAAAEGRPVRHADPVAYAAALAPGSVDAVVVTDLVEHLDRGGLTALAAAVARVLAPDGRAVVEGRHPAALWAVGNELWRDAGRRRPVHPDAVRMALEAAGLGTTSVALHDPPEHLWIDASDASVAPVAGRVNEALFGPRLYAVHAAR